MIDNRKLEKATEIKNQFPPVTKDDKRPTRRAAAISYDPDMHDVPILSAFGEGNVADKIVALAKESGVPVLPDPSLASLLSKISVGDEIPEELYQAVAKILVFVSEVDRSYSEKLKGSREN